MKGQGMQYAIVNTAANNSVRVIKEPRFNIRIVESDNPLKLPVARVCAEWLSAPARAWRFNGSIDKNMERLASYLREMFPEYTWIVNSSQKAFDIVSPDANIVIEGKSVHAGKRTLTANATIYPVKVPGRDTLPSRYFNLIPEDALYDVLVVAVDRRAGKVHDFRIVDGDFWNVTLQDYIECRNLFTNMNSEDFKTEFYTAYTKAFPTEAGFINKVKEGGFGIRFNLDLRKLITMTNPVSVPLGVSGVWGICGK